MLAFGVLKSVYAMAESAQHPDPDTPTEILITDLQINTEINLKTIRLGE